MDAFSLPRQVVHNGAIVRGEGPWEVLTTPEQWAYALELPAVSDTPTSPLVVRFDVTATQVQLAWRFLGTTGVSCSKTSVSQQMVGW